MANIVNMGLKVRIYPDEDMVQLLEQNIGNSRFLWNNILSRYNDLYRLFKFHNCPLSPNTNNLNAILKMLKEENDFLYDSESSSLQQVRRDLTRAFTKFFKEGCGYPKFKSKKNSTLSFRIQKNGNNIRFTNKKIHLPKLGDIKYRTSKKYKKLLKKSKINNVTVKRENGEYYAIVNIKTSIEPLEKTEENVGIDLGFEKLATLSTGQKIANIDLKKETDMIKKYQKKLSRQKYNSNNYKKTLKKYHKWVNKKNNKIKDTYNKLSKYLVKKYDLIAMEDLNIKGMFKNKKWAPKLQRISLYKLVNMVKYKSQWYDKEFIQIDRFFPSTKRCSECGFINQKITIKTKEWECPKCKTKHDRDVNAAKNILQEAIKMKN